MIKGRFVMGLVFVLSWVNVSIGEANAGGLVVRDHGNEQDFPLFVAGKPAAVWVDSGDYKVTRIAAGLFGEDIQRVSGVRVAPLSKVGKGVENVVLIGTLGHSSLIDRLVAEQKLDVGAIRGKWESCLISVVREPLPGVKTALVIAGSDRRGAAFGVFTLSEAMGVSPWYWWADVTPIRREQLFVAGCPFVQGPPSVKYRGIFINDEVFGILPWSTLNFEKRKYMGPKTYAKVFELLLRLKANTCWPAMVYASAYFNVYSENKQVADDYAIVMGSSHCEPMLFNNSEGGCSEWEVKTDGEWNFLTNRQRIVQAWEKRLKANGKFENLYTIGLRGIADRPIEGATAIPEKVAILNQAIDTQRQMLARFVNADPATIPQVFCPYKEVLALYRAGAKIPDDVTLLWADDNHGYMRELPTPEEQKRAGGSGVYYHLGYFSYPWLNPFSPALIHYELRKAYDYGANRVWIFNVGDIKPMEKELTFALRLAWNIQNWTPEAADGFIADWAGQTFGQEFSQEIAHVCREFYRLNARGITEYVDANYLGDYPPQEANERLQAYCQIGDQAEALAKRIPARLQDAYFQLVLYPVQGARLVNEKILLSRQSLDLAAKGDSRALDLAGRARSALSKVDGLSKLYNETIAKGKWRHMMCWHPQGQWPAATPELVAQGKKRDGSGSGVTAGGMMRVPAVAGIDPVLRVPAHTFSRKHDGAGAGIRVFPGLGFSPGVSTLPFTAAPLKMDQLDQASFLEYDLEIPAGDMVIKIRALPTQRIHEDGGVRYAVSLNQGQPRLFDQHVDAEECQWYQNIFRGYSLANLDYPADQPRRLNVRIYLLDPGVVLQDLLVEAAQRQPTPHYYDAVRIEDDHGWKPEGENDQFDLLGLVAMDQGWRACRRATAPGWFSWTLNVHPEQANDLVCTYWGSETNREFDILVDGVQVATQKPLVGSNDKEFVDQRYVIPRELTRGKHAVTVRFQPKPGKSTNGVYGCRILASPSR